MKFTTRDTRNSGAPIEYDDILRALASPSGKIIAWDDIEQWCCLDVDEGLVDFIKPNPSYQWVSRSGRGFHALYKADGIFHADEIASLAILYLRSRHPQLHKFELLKHTFQPPGQYYETTQSLETDALESLLGTGESDPDAIESWLESRGFERGRRYPHSLCPINPTDSTNRDPVMVYDAGVYCHVCNATGGYGWYSFNRIGRNVRYSDFAVCVYHKTHWEHAKHILRPITELSDTINKRIYSAALVYRHGADVRKETVFFPRRNLIRLGRWWGTETGELYNAKIEGMLAALPVCQYKGKKGKHTSAERLSKLQQTVDLSDVGYPSVEIIRGCKIYGHWLERIDHTYTTVLCSPLLERREYEPYRPRYIPEEKRDTEFAWSVLAECFPGIVRSAVEILIAAKGCAEGRIGLPPFLFVSGPSGAAKTSSVLIAAAICGDINTSVVWTNQVERVRQGILDGKHRGSFVTLNEICKCASKAGVKFQSAMDDMLNLTPDSVSHQLYIGPIPLGQLPVLVWTDTEVPFEIRDSVQLARRLIHVRMPKKQEWEKSIYNSGVHQIERLRVTSIEYADACNVILSDVIDRYFQTPQDLRTIAKNLGYSLLSEEVGDYHSATLLEFFRAISQLSGLSLEDRRRFPEEGWLWLKPNTPAMNIWQSICDSDNPATSRRCSEADWSRILDLDKPVEFMVQSHSNKTVIRFCLCGPDGRYLAFNGGIK